MKKITYSLADLTQVAMQIIQQSQGVSLILFEGEVGAGKTTLIKAICKELGVEDVASSPTFSIINEYTTIDESMVYHIDLYRLKSLDEALEIGIDEYIYADGLCLIEWPQILEDLIFDEKALKIEIKTIGEKRELLMELVE
jgi:tRNA threonylcarbamoyladenosine biosynthesis protein TsaE